MGHKDYRAVMDLWVRGGKLLKHPRLLLREDEIYSYGLHYLLGRKVEWPDRGGAPAPLVLINSTRRSVTTSRQQGELEQACRRAHVQCVRVLEAPMGDARSLIEAKLATLDETIALMARLALLAKALPVTRLRRIQNMTALMLDRLHVAALLGVERRAVAELETELAGQGWPGAEIDALGVEVGDNKRWSVGFPKLHQEIETWRAARRLRKAIRA